ncbi:MAG: hypothetical protein KGZ89_06175 [Actinobacteria bacterium]|nr:hypothetical protein [Actinomycetota bacterium]
MFGKSHLIAASELAAHQELGQTDMAKAPKNFAEMVKEVNRWENGKTVPFKLARKQFEAFCERMAGQGKLNLDNKDIHL